MRARHHISEPSIDLEMYFPSRTFDLLNYGGELIELKPKYSNIRAGKCIYGHDVRTNPYKSDYQDPASSFESEQGARSSCSKLTAR